MSIRLAKDVMPNIDEQPGRPRAHFPELRDEAFWELYDAASKYSLVNVTGFYNAYQTMHYIARNAIPGDFVECGCFLGGMGIFIALLRERLKLEGRQLFLFDTFDGFPKGTEDVFMGRPQKGYQFPSSFLPGVVENFKQELGHIEGVKFVVGPVEETAPAYGIGAISLLRLDTDFYSSTRVELETFYPKLSRGGALIVDDYGMFDGSRRATDEYLGQLDRPPLLNRIDMGIWAGVKP